jgi:hypothetical protein
MTVNTELDLENKEALKKAAFLAATVNTAPDKARSHPRSRIRIAMS